MISYYVITSHSIYRYIYYILKCYLNKLYSSKECINQIRELYMEGEHNIGYIAEEMLDLALTKGN